MKPLSGANLTFGSVENFRLVQPSQFLSHVRPVINTTAPRASVSSQNQSTPTVQPASISNPQGVPGANIQAVAEPEMATLLDEDVDRADEPREPGPRKSYAEDLLDMSIEEPSDLPPPMELSSKIEEGSVHPAVLEADEHEMASQLESFMPVLQSLLSPEIIGHINSELRRMNIAPGQPSQRTDPAADTTQEKHAKAQQSAIQNEYRPLQSRKQESRVPPPSLANLVEKRTQEWSQQVIASTLTYKGPIFGEHLVRSRWSERHNSSASVASSTGLVEGIRKLRLDETQAPVAPPPVDSAKSQPLNTTVSEQLFSRSGNAHGLIRISQQYATANPFGPKPTTGGQDQPGSTRTRQTSIFGSAAPPRESQLPDYVRSSYQPGDHGAAVRAQYLGIASTRMSGHGNSVTTSTRNPQSPQATHGSREADTTSSQGASSMHLNAIGSTLNDGQHLPGKLYQHTTLQGKVANRHS